MKKSINKSAKADKKTLTKWDLAHKEPPVSPAYCPLKFEDERHGRNLLRSMVHCINGSKHGFNVEEGLWLLYGDAIGKPPEWSGCRNEAGEIISHEKHKASPPEEAAADLISLALDSVKFVQMLFEKKPDLCRAIARTLGEWPVSTDLTAKDWKRAAQKTVDDLGLGSAISGFLNSARTSDENPIRLYATAIHETLFQTRWIYREADGQNPLGKYKTREGCPAWAAKTLELPKFIKANVGAWMKVGREMLLEQRPDFIEDSLFGDRKFKWTRSASGRCKSGNPTLRAIQNLAFDDIRKEMKNLAPAEDLFRGKW